MTNKQKRKIEKKYFGGFIPTKEDRIWCCEEESDFEKNCWKQLNYCLNRQDPDLNSSIRMVLEDLRALRMARIRRIAYFDQMK